MKKLTHEDVLGDTRKMLLTAFRHRNACYNLTHAALVLLAANRTLTPHDALMDACQMYCHVLRVKWRCLRSVSRHSGRSAAPYRAPSRRPRKS